MRTASRVGIALLALLAACGDDGGIPGEEERKAPEPPPEAMSRETEHGPVKARVQLWPTSPRLGDDIYLRLTVESRPGTEVVAEFEHEALGRFRVIDWDRDGGRKGDGTQLEIQTFTLEAPGSGKYRVPPLRVAFTAPPAGDKAQVLPEELLTEELPIEVAPVDPTRATEALAPARATLKPSRTTDYTYAYMAASGVLAAAAIGAAFVLGRVRRQRELRSQVSAYDLAMASLHYLAKRGAPEGDAVDAWFVELSAIVRRYLEGRYGVRAPELTTEEFLQEARRAANLPASQRELLEQFLERCDRVKFAGYRPDAAESMATLEAARAFVEDTRLRAEPGVAA